MSLSPPNLPSRPLSDQLTIETPEQTSLEFAVAGIGSRFLAMAIDTLIQTAVAALFILLPILAVASSAFRASSRPWIIAILVLILFALYYAYFPFFEAIWNGQTPGKRIIRIRVVKDDGRPINAIESVGRNLLRLVDQLPLFYGVGIVTALLNKKSKRLGDLLAGTIVVHERTLEDIKPIWQSAPSIEGLRLGTERLTTDDLVLVETFLNRRDALAPDVRYNAAVQIMHRLKPKLDIPEAVTLRPEKLLEAIAAERRSSARYT